MSKEKALLNPEIKPLVIGVRESKEISVYPLTYFDHKDIGQKVTAFLAEGGADASKSNSDIEYVGTLTAVLEENVGSIIGKCTDMSEEDFMKNITAGQLMDFITIVIEVNFLNPILKGTRLFTEMGSMYGVKPLSQPSVENMGTNSVTSPTPIKKVD